MAGIDIPTVQAISGHKTTQMVMRYAHQHNNHVRNAMDALQNCYESNSVIPLQRKNYTEITQTHQSEINPNTQTPMMTRGKAHNKKYPQGNSNPCRLREREVS